MVGMALGRHETVEFYDCSESVLNNRDALEKIFVQTARDAGATVIESFFHAFAPQGVSGVVVISESHFAVHAWPEFGYAAVDLFTCGDSIDFKRAVDGLTEGLQSRSVIVSGVLFRGIPDKNGETREVPVYGGGSTRLYSLNWRDSYCVQNAVAISLAIDFRGVPPENDAGLLTDREFWKPFETELRSGTGRCRELADGGFLALARGPRGNLHLDFLHFGFVEPRGLAEALMSRLGGNGYRMQVGLRK